MDQKQIDRINELARKAKSPEGLTEWEAAERAALRREYVDAVLGTGHRQRIVEVLESARPVSYTHLRAHET